MGCLEGVAAGLIVPMQMVSVHLQCLVAEGVILEILLRNINHGVTCYIDA